MDDLTLVSQGRAYIANGTGRAVRLSKRLSHRDVAGAMSAILGETVSPTTSCRFELRQRRGSARYAAAYAQVINGLLEGAD